MNESKVFSDANEIAALIAQLPKDERIKLWGVLVGMGLAKSVEKPAS